MVQQQEKAVIRGRLGTLTLECESLFAREVIELNSKLMNLMEAELMEIHHLREHAPIEEECQCTKPETPQCWACLVAESIA